MEVKEGGREEENGSEGGREGGGECVVVIAREVIIIIHNTPYKLSYSPRRERSSITLRTEAQSIPYKCAYSLN